MTEKNYTHKIVMFDVNSAVRRARFTDDESAFDTRQLIMNGRNLIVDDAGEMFIINNMVKINAVEVIEND